MLSAVARIKGINMLTKRTVFVLGAGASKPFDFPTGRELRDQAISGLRPNNQLFDQVARFGNFLEQPIVEFRDTFRNSSRTSVDGFLERRQEFMKIEKTVIAAALIAREQHMQIFDRNAADWMGYLFNHIGDTLFQNAQGECNISFITFNYDRTLEHFLFTALKNGYGLTDEQSAQRLRSVFVIHLHGSLGHLPWQTKGEYGRRPFLNEISTETLAVSIDGIKIVHENLSDGRDEEFKKAKALLGSAERVYFLGFGYGATNVERLGLRHLQCPAIGTGAGLTDHEVSYIRKMVDSKVNVLKQYDCLNFLRNVVEWD